MSPPPVSFLPHAPAPGGSPPPPLPFASGRSGWGAAVDVGTTTLAVAAYDLSDGTLICEKSALNPQVEFGHDVLARVSRAMEGDAEALRVAAVRGVERLVRSVGADAAGDPLDVTIVGNPTMIHLLLGRDPAPLAAVPYQGVLTEALEMSAVEAGLVALGDALVRVGPAASAFVGSDAVAGLIATGLPDRGSPSLLVDLGTNGEIILRSDDGLVAASAAAGPALEGVEIECGMRAESGAIDGARFENGTLTLSTVCDAPPQGICGSGLIDLGAALVLSGAVGPTGRLRMRSALADIVTVGDAGARVELTEAIHLSQQDIRQLQLAKGAIATAIGMVLEKAGVNPEDVGEVVVGGAFGSHVDAASLATIGMIPRVWVPRVSFRGNIALRGAAAMLLDPSLFARARALARDVRTVPLAASTDFQSRFIASLDFPEP